MTRRRVLVTGAGGFVGHALVSGFSDLGWNVVALDRTVEADLGGHGMQRVTADLAEGVPEEVPGVDLVIHGAWVTTDPELLGISRAAYFASNLDPLLAVLDYASRTRPAAFVFLSSSGVFAPEDAADGLADTDRPTGTSPYAAAKRAGEALVPSALDGATAAHVVRLGHLYGPGEVGRPSRLGVSRVARWVSAAREGRRLEVRADDPLRDWTFTPDLAPALEKLVDGPSWRRPIHLGSPHVWRDRALAALVVDVVAGPETDGAARSPIFVPATGRTKPPMIPSDIPVLREYIWTEPTAGLRELAATQVRTASQLSTAASAQRTDASAERTRAGPT